MCFVVVLDPRISYEGLCKDYQDDNDLLEELDKAKANLRQHFLSNYASTGTSIADPIPDPTVPNGSPQKISFISRYSKKRRTAIFCEIDEYFRLTKEPEPFDTVDPLQWWYAQRDKFPNLYHLARDILAIPGTLDLVHSRISFIVFI
jgi:hypothetical protein